MHRLLRRTLFVGSAALGGAVLWGAQSASADDGADQAQEAVVENSTTQEASAVVDSGQFNVSSPVSVGGGGGGNVSQSNSADNAASASNENSTEQVVEQGQASSEVTHDGDAGSGGQDQGAAVSNTTDQSADAAVDNGQANVSAPVSVGSEGGGDVTQSNTADNAATATNSNSTGQYVAQGQGASTIALGGDASGGGQSQDAIVDNWTAQDGRRRRSTTVS